MTAADNVFAHLCQILGHIKFRAEFSYPNILIGLPNDDDDQIE